MSILFERFRKIPSKGYYDQMAYYSYYFYDIKNLSFLEYIQIKLSYLTALYHLEKLNIFNYTADQMLIEIINHENFNEEHKIIYKEVLLLKARYLQDLKKLNEAIKIYLDLFKMNVKDRALRKTLISLLFQRELMSYQRHFAWVVICVLITFLLIYIDAMVIKAAYPHLHNLWFAFYIFSFGLAICITGAIFIKSYVVSKNRLKGGSLD
ncbi:MAG: hypothetical protein IPH93_02900 [Saprospiraceae bacterium]|nr:hypothetical protein [Saprospiraceae bacterium]